MYHLFYSSYNTEQTKKKKRERERGKDKQKALSYNFTFKGLVEKTFSVAKSAIFQS